MVYAACLRPSRPDMGDGAPGFRLPAPVSLAIILLFCTDHGILHNVVEFGLFLYSYGICVDMQRVFMMECLDYPGPLYAVHLII